MTVKILVVDDDPVVLDMLDHTLQKEPGYCIFKASSAREALQIATEIKPALILSDYYMPGIDGFEFCRQIKEHTELFDTLFMLLTSATESENKIQGLDIGADDYITKPFSPDELRSKIRAMLRIRALQEELKRDKSELVILHTNLEASHQGVLTLLTHMVGMRVPNAVLRSEQAAKLVTWIARRLSIDPDAQRELLIAARLHEIGKIVIADWLLKKPADQLTSDDRDIINQFPILGQRLLESVPHLQPVAKLIRHQLENFDGTGFPDRLAGERIPLGARILRMAVFLETRTTPQSSTEEVIDLIQRVKGTILSPTITQLTEEYILLEKEPDWLQNKRQVAVEELEPGMVIAMDLCAGSGTKLLSRETKLTTFHISKIQSIHLSDPIINEIYVHTDDATVPDSSLRN